MQPPPLSQSQQLAQYDYSDSSRNDSRARNAARERLPPSAVRFACQRAARARACPVRQHGRPGQRTARGALARRRALPHARSPCGIRSRPGRRTGAPERIDGPPRPRGAWEIRREAWAPPAPAPRPLAATGQTRRTRSHATWQATAMTGGGGEIACPCPPWASGLLPTLPPASQRYRARG